MDDKFNEIIDSLRKQKPSELQVQKWKNAVRQTDQPHSISKKPTVYWSQMLAAVFVGVVIGGLIFGDLNLAQNEKNQEIAYEDATIEIVYTKL